MKPLFTLLLVFAIGLLVAWPVRAQSTINFKSTINPGTLVASIRSAQGIQVDKPNVDFGRFVHAFDCRVQGSGAMKATLGTEEQRVYVTNPKAALGGWTLSITPQNLDSAQWTSDNSQALDINDPAGDGCIDGDKDGAAGLMSVDFSNSKIQSDCLECSTNFVSTASKSGEINFARYSSITLAQASDKADILGRWYLTGVEFIQSIPAAQEGGDYSINFVITATAT